MEFTSKKFASLYSTNCDDIIAPIKLIKSPRLRVMIGRTKSFRSIDVTPPTISARRHKRRRSKSEFIRLPAQTVNHKVSTNGKKSPSYLKKGFRQHKIMSFSENTNALNIRPMISSPFTFLPHSLPKTKEKWLHSYYKESELFQSSFSFISLKFQELLHITYKDQHPSSFRIAMAFELLSTLLEKSNMNIHETVLMKNILRLVVEGIYSNITYYPFKKPLEIKYHTLIQRKPYFKILADQDEKTLKLQHYTEDISAANIERLTKFFLKYREKRSCRAQFIIWKMHSNNHGKLFKYQIRSQIFYKWKQILQESKTTTLRNIARQINVGQNVLSGLKKTRKRCQPLRLFQDQLKNQTNKIMMAYTDNKEDVELIKANLSYYKKISECRSVFIIEFQKIMETRLRLMLAKEKLMEYLREYETSFNRKHYSFVLMKDKELNQPWNDKEHASPLKQLSIEVLVLRWINFHLKRFKKMYPDQDDYKRVSNFSRDLDDGKIYWWLLRALGLIDDIPMSFDRKTVKDLHGIICELGLNQGLLITEMDILQGNTANNFVFCVNIMFKYPNITLQNKYVSQDVMKLDHLFVESEKLLKNTIHEQFSFSQPWLRKATQQNELMSNIYEKYGEFQGKAQEKLDIINKLHYEFDSILHNAQSYSLKVLSSSRRGIKLLIEDSRGLREIKELATINQETFLKFYKFPNSIDKLSKKPNEERGLYLQAVLDKCQKCLRENTHIIKHIFASYAKRNGDAEILDEQELEIFGVDMKLRQEMKGFYSKSEHGILKQDFATFLCELCWNREAKKNPKIFTRSFRRFITNLWQHAKTSLEIENVLSLPKVQEILEKHKIALQQIFRGQSVTDSRSKMMFITKKKWTELLSKYGIVGTKLAHQIFDVCNSNHREKIQGKDAVTKMIYEEFVEGLLAVAMIKNSNIFIPLSHRIEGFFDRLCVAATARKIKF